MIPLLLALPASAADLATVASNEGLAAAHQQILAIVAATRAKKVARALADAGLGRVTVPVRPFRGAELVVTGADPASACTWDGDLACRFTVRTESRVEAGDYEVVCRSSLGASLPVPSALVEAGDGAATFEVTKLGACFDLGQELLLQPTAATDLEGIGEGTELIPPELTGLTRVQVEDAITSRLPVFRHCLVREGGAPQTGRLVVAYVLAEDGHATARAETSTLADPAVQACILERFEAIPFPKPMGGWDRGSYPFTFQ